MSRLGYSVKILREARGLTSAQLAIGADISPAYLSLIEGGDRVPPPDTLQRIASALGVDVTVLQIFSPSISIPPRGKTVRDLADALRRVGQANDVLRQRLGLKNETGKS